MTLIEQKKEMKKKLPRFTRQDAHKKKKLAKKWRKPKGLHSKMREKLRGYRKSVNAGYGTPRSLRGLDSEGNKMFFVKSEKDLEGLSSGSAIIVSSGTGAKKIIAIIEKAKKLNLKIKNIDAEAFFKKLEQRKLEKQSKQKISEEKKKKKEKQAKEEKPKENEEELSEEDRKNAEKQEKDKLLTKKDMQ